MTGFRPALGALWVAAAAAAVGLTGCVVAPVAPYRAEPAGVVYVEPAYASPGPGWVWMSSPRYGWGWHHPHRGWHRGWRD